jgi:uncharacterized protein YggE
MKSLSLLFIAIFICSCTENIERTITLNVNNSVQIPVEYVKITVTVTERGEDPAAVELAGYESLSGVVNLLREIGFGEDDVEITAGAVSATRVRDTPYQFQSTLLFDIYDLDKIDSIRRAVIGEGGTAFRVSSYGNRDEESIYDEAYRNAIESARERADRLLSSEPLHAGNVLKLRENIRENVLVTASAPMDEAIELNLSASLGLGSVEPMFNKEYYTKAVQFSVEFELINN